MRELPKIDAHHHLWDLKAVYYPWLSDHVEPKMWGPSMIGFGKYRYRYESGRTGEAMRLGFAPRKGKVVLYLFVGDGLLEEELAVFGKHTRSVACIYVNKLADIDLAVLEKMVAKSWEEMRVRYPQ